MIEWRSFLFSYQTHFQPCISEVLKKTKKTIDHIHEKLNKTKAGRDYVCECVWMKLITRIICIELYMVVHRVEFAGLLFLGAGGEGLAKQLNWEEHDK